MPDPTTPNPRGFARVFTLAFIASFILGVAWMIAISPFRGMDEFDHAYRADSVANGYWAAKPGGAVVVDRTFVDAIDPVCLSRRDLDTACVPDAAVGERLTVVSTAGAYNPIFYWVVGTVTSPFDGYDRLYAMRLCLIALNSALFATAALIALRCFRTPWPAFALLLTLTPQATSAEMVVAANGLESACALVVWMALLAAAHGAPSRRWSATLPVVAAAAGTAMGVMRTLGPLWLACIVAAVVLSAGATARHPRSVIAVVRATLWNKAWLVCFVLWTVSSIAGAAWVLASGTNSLSPLSESTSVSGESGGSGERGNLLLRPIVWIFQLVGALPYRDQPLPIPLYGVVVTLWCVLVVLAARRASPPFRRSVAAVALVSLAIPLTFDVVTGLGTLWQGRYCWPLVMGVFLLLSVAAEKSEARFPRAVPMPLVAGVAVVVAATMSWALVHVLASELADSPLAGTSAWWTLPAPVLAAVPFVAILVAIWGLVERPVEQVTAQRVVPPRPHA